jgi:hypothetical protein
MKANHGVYPSLLLSKHLEAFQVFSEPCFSNLEGLLIVDIDIGHGLTIPVLSALSYDALSNVARAKEIIHCELWRF